MNKNITILFDLDGTLLNTSKGIVNSYKHTIKKLNLQHKNSTEIIKYIGRNLKDVFINEFKLDSKESANAIKIYRDYYSQQGIFEYSKYKGLKKALNQLKNSHFKLGVITLKMQLFAESILKDANLFHLFDFINGVTNGIEENKSEMIRKVISENNSNFVLIGDSLDDFKSAKKNQIFFIAVLYGFGFKDIKKIKYKKMLGYINRPSLIGSEISNILGKRI